jgi:dimethylglycine dehydrogenase
MKPSYRAVVIGGGVVGASVLYHLAKLGWSDIALIERKELTAGSTWHAAAGFHALNADPNIASLQGYTIQLYREIERESGQAVGVHMTGGINLAGTPERWKWLQAMWAIFKTMGLSAELVTPAEIAKLCPIVDVSNIHGGLYDPNEGHLDPYGTTHAYAKAARNKGAEVITNCRVLELNPRADGGWDVVTEQGTVRAEHVVNAAGLWAQRVAAMAGIKLPVTPMEHHYLLTEEIPEVAALDKELPLTVDLEGFTYLRQEHKGLLLGVYELNPKHWNVDGAPWDYGTELIPEDVDRIAPELEIGFRRFPCLANAGIRRWVNGAFTFTPDGNPLVGPVPGLKNYWVACGVMAGFSQGGGVGLSLAEWMVEGEPSRNVFGMDVARYGPFSVNRKYLLDRTGEFYQRRFVLTYPNEQLPAGRPVKMTPAYDAMKAAGAQFSAIFGLEAPLYFAPAPDFQERPTLERSNAFDLIAAEVKATREAVALTETAAFSRYEVNGPGAEKWLDRMLACRLPGAGRMRLAPMLSPSGRLMGDLTVLRLAEDRFWLMGSYYLQTWHMRWLRDHLPDNGVTLRNICDEVTGFAIAGPRSRDMLASLVREDVSNASFRFLTCREMDVGLTTALVARVSVTGELGYEFNVPAACHRALYDILLEAGKPFGLRQAGFRAMNSLRLEKSFGVWSAEFTWEYTPRMSGLDRFIAFDKGDFIGRDAARKAAEGPAPQMLVTLDVDATDADASGFEPVWIGERKVGFVTSGGYGHHVDRSLAMAYVDPTVAAERPEVEVHIVGVRRRARILSEPAWDPNGSRMRS